MKINSGKQILEQGMMELEHLLGKGGGSNVTEKVKKIIKAAPARKAAAGKISKTTKKRVLTKTNEGDEESVLAFIKKDQFATKHKLMKNFKWDFYRTSKMVDDLLKKGLIKIVRKQNPNLNHRSKNSAYNYMEVV
jgi:predicted HTH transcriptional regulator